MPSNLIANFAPGDRIDLANIAAQSFAFSGPAGTFTAINNTGGIITDYSFPLSTTGGDDFVIGPDGQGGTMITSVPITSDFNGDGKSDILLDASNGTFIDLDDERVADRRRPICDLRRADAGDASDVMEHRRDR